MVIWPGESHKDKSDRGETTRVGDLSEQEQRSEAGEHQAEAIVQLNPEVQKLQQELVCMCALLDDKEASWLRLRVRQMLSINGG